MNFGFNIINGLKREIYQKEFIRNFLRKWKIGLLSNIRSTLSCTIINLRINVVFDKMFCALKSNLKIIGIPYVYTTLLKDKGFLEDCYRGIIKVGELFM